MVALFVIGIDEPVRNKLYREACTATAGSTCIGVLKSKSPVIQTILPIDLHTI